MATNHVTKADKPSFSGITHYSRNHSFIFHRISNLKFSQISSLSLPIQVFKLQQKGFMPHIFDFSLHSSYVYVYLSNNSLISMKLIPYFYLCILYKPTKFQLHTSKCQRIRVHLYCIIRINMFMQINNYIPIIISGKWVG